jgi:hypothetical protein
LSDWGNSNSNGSDDRRYDTDQVAVVDVVQAEEDR